MALNLAAGAQSPIGDLAKLSGVREALQWFTREKQWINEQHLELCRIPSPTFLEHRRAEWMVSQFKSYGCETQIDRAGNVLAFVEPGAKGPAHRADCASRYRDRAEDARGDRRRSGRPVSRPWRFRQRRRAGGAAGGGRALKLSPPARGTTCRNWFSSPTSAKRAKAI